MGKLGVAMVAAVLVASGAADDLSPVRLAGLSLKVPGAWKVTKSKDSHRYDAPSEDASFEISVFPVEPARDPKTCLDQLLGALGGEGWERISVGAAPAARRTETEAQAGTSEGKPIEIKTTSVVGCDGKTKWVLTLSASSAKSERFDALATKLLASLQYPRP